MTADGGIINVFKPEGLTSFDVVARVRRMFGTRRVGHCGTLDPFARGVLPVCVGRATAAVRYMDGYDKRYRVDVAFGSQTDTQDRTGRVIRSDPPGAAERERLRATDFAALKEALKEFEGTITQIPPMYSAVKVNGMPLYRYARRGLEPERAAREVRVYSIVLAEASADPEFTAVLDIHCSKGTYIRTICDDLGNRMTYGAHARELCRTACGPFTVEDAVSLDEIGEALRSAADPQALFGNRRGFYRTEYALSGMARISLADGDALRLIHGQTVTVCGEPPPDGRMAVYADNGRWIGVAVPDGLPAGQGLEGSRYGIMAERIFTDAQQFGS